jgi:flagellar FliJ protein
MTQVLQTLLEHAERERDQALAAMLRCEDAVRRLQQQGDQLRAYRDDYRGRHPAQAGRSASIEQLRVHQNFMQRLDQALQQHDGQLQAAQLRSATLRAALVAKETRVASVRKLQERRSQQARQRESRQEQRRSDDAVQHQRRDEGLSARHAAGDALPVTH